MLLLSMINVVFYFGIQRTVMGFRSAALGRIDQCHARLMIPSVAPRKTIPRGGSNNVIKLLSSTTESEGTVAATSDGDVVPWKKLDRVVLDELPTVYVYDHCPFCVRVRFALGLKNIKHSIYFLANDDVKTPTKLIGKKVAPIFQHESLIMPESMDIIKMIDADAKYGPTGVFAPASGRTDLNAWQGSVKDLLRGLQRPRYVATGLLPEFQQLDGRHAFIKNHEMVGYSKAEWKELPVERQLQIYAEAMAKDPASDIEELNRKLIELNDILFSEHHSSPTKGISYDDIDLFSRLRSITIIRDVDWPTKLRSYMDNMSELSDVPLYDEMAL